MNIFDCINQYADFNKNKIAISDGKREITYYELREMIQIDVERLRKEGYHSGGKVILKNCGRLEYIVTFLSLLALECWVIPISNDMTDDELEKIIRLTEGVVVENIGISSEVGPTNFKGKLGIHTERCGILHMTSGSTGEPKFCIRTLKALEYEGQSYISTFSLNHTDVLLSGAPLHHSYALGGAIFPALLGGACLLIINKFVPRQLLRLVEEYHVTFMLLVPVMAKMLCDMYSIKRFDTSSLRIVLVGAGSITEDLYNNFLEKYKIYLMSNYGSTETGGLVSRLEPFPVPSIGKVMDGTEIKLCDEEGRSVQEGQLGEIYVKTKGMFLGYYNNDDVPFDANGFFPMGDLAIKDENDYIYIKGRKKLLINAGGKKINPIEVEKIIQEIESVKECVVVGVKKANNNEIVKAYVVADSLTKEEIIQYCRTKLSTYKIPGIIEFVSKIPRNSVGKINRNALMDKEH